MRAAYSPSLFAIEGSNIGYAVFALAGTILLTEASRSASTRATASGTLR